ncbi:MAG: LacI family DNA-binding transcriptional regulator [Acidobacteria bacterium]|nr:LacI family DNA-binding transcriptional regulator [Acidobacteriota bacterium]
MSLRQIAKLANVSTATVSRTVNRVPTVDAVLARRVWRAIEQVGCYPNTQTRAPTSGRSRIFGLIASERDNPFSPEFGQLGARHNYEILLTSVEEIETISRILPGK